MTNFLKTYRIPLILVFLLGSIHFISKDLTNPYQKPIAGDAEGYYAYLPAIFIYQDLDYNFRYEIEAEHYIQGLGKSYVKEVDGEKVNKTFPGVTVLYTPFFLIAHGIALTFGLDADGYSFIYQLCFDIGFWFYFFLGLVFAFKILKKFNISDRFANMSLFVLVLGTNIFFYSVYDISVTHIYNFFLINAGIYYLLQFRDENHFKSVLYALVFLSLAVISRPTNVLILFVILFFFPKAQFYRDLVKKMRNLKNVLYAVLICFSIAFIPLILWKVQTGNWIVYSYGDEGFNFGDPYLISFLFSFMKGWFIYTPIALLILIGGSVLVFKENKIQFTWMCIFYLLAFYVFSSWWCWYYGAGMGQRVMIDFTIILIFLLAKILDYLQTRKAMFYTGMTVSVLLIGLNLAQAYQIKNGILANGTPTKACYWDNFLVFEKRARVYPYEHWELIREEELLAENEVMYVDQNNAYSEVAAIKGLKCTKGDKIILSFEANAEEELDLSRLEVKLNATCAMYPRYTFFLHPYEKENEWVFMQFLIEPDQDDGGIFHCYLWNAKSGESVAIRGLRLTQYHSDEYY